MKKQCLFALVVFAFACLSVSLAAAATSSRAGGAMLRTSHAALSSQAGAGQALSVVGTSFLDSENDLVPADVTVSQRLETPTLVSVTAPNSNQRSLYFVCASGAHQYEQVPSSAPFTFIGRYQLHITNAALPSELILSFGMNTIQESQPSALDSVRTFDPSPCAAIDATVLTPFIQDSFGVTADQAAAMTQQVLTGDTTISMNVVVRLQSVASFNLFNAALNVFSN